MELNNLLTEMYFENMFSRLDEMSLRGDLKKWNLAQKKMWLDLVMLKYVSKNDVDAFFKFAKYFAEYFEKFGKQPSRENVEKEICGKKLKLA